MASKALTSEIRVWVEVALQDCDDKDCVADFAAGRLYDGGEGVDEEAHQEFRAMDSHEAMALVTSIANEY